MNFIDKYFGITKAGSTFRKEIIGGLVTFLTLSYIVVVNPSILTDAIPGAFTDAAIYSQFFGAFMVATILSAVIGTFIMAFWAKYPFALAPGMGLNAFFAYGVCLGMGIDWRIALTAIFIEGIIFMAITLGGLRSLLVKAFPKSLKVAIGVGIGLFIALIGLQNSGLVVSNPATMVSMGELTPSALIAVFGFILTVILYVKKVPGAILFGIIGSAILSWITGIAEFSGVVGAVPSIEPVFAQLNFSPDVIFTFGFLAVILSFFFVDFFDTAGTLMGVSMAAGLSDKDGNLERDKEAFMADAIATTAGAVLGTSTTTTYIESAAGISEGARTGFASVITGAAMLSMLFFAPFITSIPAIATAPALVFVGFLMMKMIGKISWDDITEAIPAYVTIIMMPLTYSITHGIALGFILYPIMKIFAGKKKDINWLTWVLFAIFVLYLIIEV